jgi:hypothetical protein
MQDSTIDPVFVARVREIEERLFSYACDPADSVHMKSDGYSWLYRPSHHASTGLVTAADIRSLSLPGMRLLSVGGHPAYLERTLVELGVPASNIVAADVLPAIAEANLPFETACFDMLGPWPEMGAFDRIIFPESLCIALTDRLKKTGPHGDAPFATDPKEARLLSEVLCSALARLRTGGEIRVNGPQSHPNVVKAARSLVEAHGFPHALDYQRYFLTVRGAN